MATFESSIPSTPLRGRVGEWEWMIAAISRFTQSGACAICYKPSTPLCSQEAHAHDSLTDHLQHLHDVCLVWASEI